VTQAPLISLSGITKVFGEGVAAFRALKGIDLKIYAGDLGSGLIDQSQKMTVAAMHMADMKVWAQRS
jgi:ABC-type dipeptide/oligopeptide/nickel transport system ATPase subunit